MPSRSSESLSDPTPMAGITCVVQSSMNTGQNQAPFLSFGTCCGRPISIRVVRFRPFPSLNVQVSEAIGSGTIRCCLSLALSALNGSLAAIAPSIRDRGFEGSDGTEPFHMAGAARRLRAA